MTVAQLAINNYSTLWPSKQITQIYIQDYKGTAEYECTTEKMRYMRYKLRKCTFQYLLH